MINIYLVPKLQYNQQIQLVATTVAETAFVSFGNNSQHIVKSYPKNNPFILNTENVSNWWMGISYLILLKKMNK